MAQPLTTATPARPLVGRASALARILEARRNEGPGALVVSGAAGVGKSHLARDVAAAARREGAHVEWVQATRSAAQLPLGALADLVPDTARSDDVIALMRGSALALRERAGGECPLVCVDDAQLLDPASAAVVAHLAATTAFVLVTVRAAEPCPDAIVSLWKDRGAVRLELTELTDGEVSDLVESLLDGPADPRLQGWVMNVSRGNALFVCELVQGALEADAVRRDEGLWRLVATPATPPSLGALVADRMTGLGAAEQDAVELLALGEPLELPEIESLVPESALVAAEARGLLVADGREVRLAHPLYGEAVRSVLPTLRARHLRLRLVRVLEARRPFGPAEALRVARLRLDAGAELSNSLTIEAARAANRAGDPDLGCQLAELAAVDGGGLDAALLIAQAHAMRNRHADTETVLSEAEPLAAGHPNAADYLNQRIVCLDWGLGRPYAAVELLDRAAAWSDEPGWQAQVRRLRLAAENLAEGFGSARRLASIISDETVPAGERRRLRVHHCFATCFEGRGDDAARMARELQPEVPFTHFDAAEMTVISTITLETGNEWEEVERFTSGVVVAASRVPDHLAGATASVFLGRLAFQRGRYRDAARLLAQAAARFERHDVYRGIGTVRAYELGLAVVAGDFAAAERAALRLRRTVAGSTQTAMHELSVIRAEGWAISLRDPRAAAAWLLDHAESWRARRPGLAPALAYEAVRLGARAGPALSEMAATCQTRLVHAYAGHASARDARDGPGLLSAAEEMAAIGAQRYAVEAASDAATVFVAQGRLDSARRAATRAREWFVEDQGGRLPVVDGLGASAVELTRREAQLIALAREGVSNAQIAARLTLSIRTVESHLYRGMQKLGVGDRRDL